MTIRRKTFLVYLILLLALFPLFCWGLLSGSVRYSFDDLYRGFQFLFSGEGDSVVSLVIFQIRLPRLLLALCLGAALAISGAAFQGFFRNSLADPYVIGASSGAALGAGLAMTLEIPALGFFAAGGLSPVTLAAFAGSLLAVFIAFAVSRAAGNPPPAAALLLAGASVGALFSALLSFVLVVKDKNLNRVYYWLLGSLGGASWASLFPLLPLMLVGTLVIFLQSRPLDLLLQGDEAAASLGLDVARTRLIVALAASLTAAAAVSSAGIIGFVGLVAPHAARIVLGPVHRRMLGASALMGAILVLAADTLARNISPPLEIPVGIITSLAGAPFFLYLLARMGRRMGQFL
ncbi:ABC transporter permease [Spirochaetia bacterium]|nr:ABC transporter permease [Spirochaetia bacterium]